MLDSIYIEVFRYVVSISVDNHPSNRWCFRERISLKYSIISRYRKTALKDAEMFVCTSNLMVYWLNYSSVQ